jgi:hypothetical protein
MIKTDISFAIFGVPKRKSLMDTTQKILEDSTSTISIALVNCEFLGVKIE